MNKTRNKPVKTPSIYQIQTTARQAHALLYKSMKTFHLIRTHSKKCRTSFCSRTLASSSSCLTNGNIVERSFSTNSSTRHHRNANKWKIPSDDTTADDPNPHKKESLVLKVPPRAVFPWRHSAFPLPRLIPNTEEFVSQGGYIGPHMPAMNMFLRGLAWINAAGFLGAKIVNYSRWKADLEYAFQHAFAVAVQGVLEDVYQKKRKDDDGDDHDDDSIQEEDMQQDKKQKEGYTQDDNIESNSQQEIELQDKDKDNASSSLPLSSSFPISFNHFITPQDDYHLKQASEEDASHHMLEPTLVSLYRSAHTYGKHKLHIQLYSKPKQAKIESMFVLPFLTRKEVEDNLSLKHSYRNIVKALQQKSTIEGRELSYFEIGNIVAEKLDEMSTKQMQRRKASSSGMDTGTNYGDSISIMQVTVVAQVSIDCDEVFVVKDIETGDVVQGDPNGNINDVTHLVRFEIVVDMNGETGEVAIGNWQITDWDDLLDGNLFFSEYHV